MGDGRVEKSPAIGERGQAAISLRPDTDDAGSWLLTGFKSVRPLEKLIQ